MRTNSIGCFLVVVLLQVIWSRFVVCADVSYYATGNSAMNISSKPWIFVEPELAFGDPLAPAYLVSAPDSAEYPNRLPADDPISPLAGAAEIWLPPDWRNGTQFGPNLGGLAVFHIQGSTLDIGIQTSVTLTFYLRITDPSSQGLLFAVVENVWENSSTHPIADDINNGSSVAGVFVAIRLAGYRSLEYISSGSTTAISLKGNEALWDTQWHHVAVILDWTSNYMQLFVDGETSYASVEWIGCIDGTQPELPEEGVSPRVSGKYGNAAGVSLLAGGAAVWGYGFQSNVSVSLALFQVHDGVRTQTEIAVLSGNAEHVGITPAAGYSIGSVLLIICVCAAATTAITTHLELQIGEPEPETKAVLNLEKDGSKSASANAAKDAWNEPTSRKVGIVDALAEGGAIVGQVSASAATTAGMLSELMHVNKLGNAGSLSGGLAQQLVAIVPMAVAPLQGLSLYFNGWTWPNEFVAVMEKLTIPVTVDLPFIFPSIPTWIYFGLKLVAALIIVGAVVYYVVTHDSKEFDGAIKRHRTIQKLYRETIRMALVEVFRNENDTDFVAHLSSLIATAYKADWDIDDLARIAYLRGADSESIINRLRFLPPPDTEYEAALQHFAVTQWPNPNNDRDAPQRLGILTQYHNIAAVLVGPGCNRSCATVVEVVGGVQLDSHARQRLAQRLILASSAFVGQWNESIGEAELYIAMRQNISDYCQKHAIEAHDVFEAEATLRGKILRSLTAKPALAPASDPPHPVYNVMIKKLDDPLAPQLRVCEDAARELLLRAANSVTRHRSLRNSFVVPQVNFISANGNIESLVQCSVRCLPPDFGAERIYEGAFLVLDANTDAPEEAQDHFILKVTIKDKMICPLHSGYLIEAQPDHMKVRTMHRIPVMPYCCVHSRNEAFKQTEACSNNEPMSPCAQDVLYVCSNPTCSYTVCGLCARLSLSETIQILVATLAKTLTSTDLHRLLLIGILALMFPLTQEAVMVLTCHTSVRCTFGIPGGGGCYDSNTTTAFIASAVFAVLSLVVFRLGTVLWIAFVLSARQSRVAETVQTRWKGALHPEWQRLLRSDETILSGLYSKFELRYFLFEQPWLFIVQLGDCLAVALTDSNSLFQLIAASIVQLSSLLYLVITNPYIDLWQDLLAKVAALHQLLQLSLMFYHHALAGQSPTGTTTKVVVAMLAVAAAYVGFFIFVIWKRVVQPLHSTMQSDVAEALLRQQRQILSTEDVMQATLLMRELAGKFSELFGETHFLTLVAEAHVAGLCHRSKEMQMATGHARKCLEGLRGLKFAEPLGIRWRPISDIDADARPHFGVVFRLVRGYEVKGLKLRAEATETDNSQDAFDCYKLIGDVEARLGLVLFLCRKQQDRSYAAGNVLSLLTCEGTELVGMDFSKLYIRRANASNATVKEASFEGSVLRDSTFRGTAFIGVDFRQTQFSNVEIGMTKRKMKEQLVLNGHSSNVNSAVFSMNAAHILSASNDMTVRLWDAVTGELVRLYSGHKAAVKTAVFSVDETMIASASQDNTVRLWQLSSGRCVAVLKGPTTCVDIRSVEFSPNGLCIVAACGKAIRVWDSSTAKIIKTLKGHNYSVNSAVFSPDGTQILSASEDTTIRLWGTRDWTCIRILKGHTDYVVKAIFTAGGEYIFSASWDYYVRMWDGISCVAQIRAASNVSLTDYVTCVASRRDCRSIVTSSTEKSIRVWDITTYDCVEEHCGHNGSVTAVAFSPHGNQIVSSSDDKTVRIWETSPTAHQIAELKSHSRFINAVAFSPDGTKVVSCSNDVSLLVWDALTGRTIVELRGHTKAVTCAEFSPDGKSIVASSADMKIRMYDTSTWQLRERELTGHTEYVNTVSYSFDGKQIVSASDDWSVRVWCAEGPSATCNCESVLEGHTRWVDSAVFSCDATRITSASEDTTVRIWKSQNRFGPSAVWSCICVISHSHPVGEAVFSPDGTLVASVLKGAPKARALFLWDAETGANIAQLVNEQERQLKCAAFSHDGTMIAACGQQCCIWSVKTKKLLVSVHIPSGDMIRCVSFSQNDKRMVVGTAKKTIRLWNMQTNGEMLQEGLTISNKRADTVVEISRNTTTDHAIFCTSCSSSGASVMKPSSDLASQYALLWTSKAPLFFVDCICDELLARPLMADITMNDAAETLNEQQNLQDPPALLETPEELCELCLLPRSCRAFSALFGGAYFCDGKCGQGRIWGSGPYPKESHPCLAARHAGAIGPEGGLYCASPCDWQLPYEASTQNGVTTEFLPGGTQTIAFRIASFHSGGSCCCKCSVEAFHVRLCRSRNDDEGGLFFCPGNCTPRSVWGSGPYTGDSHACTAARHAGVIGSDGGLYRVTLCPGQSSFEGSARNGVKTAAWSSYPTCFNILHPPPISNIFLCKKRKESEEGVVVCPGSCMRDASVWGSGPYSGDSHACAAARHAGIIGDSGGIYRITFCPSQDSYEGSTKNGVTTCSSASRHPFSFTIGAVDESTKEPDGRQSSCEGVQNADEASAQQSDEESDASDNKNMQERHVSAIAEVQAPKKCTSREKEEEGVFFCTGRCRGGTVFGSGPYTGDSNACSAARHAGIIGDEGGAYRVTVAAGRSIYEGSKRHGFVTYSWTAGYRTSFIVSSVEKQQPSEALAGFKFCWMRKNEIEGLFICSGNCRSGSTWGSGPYSGDSHACRAARHAGVIGSDGGMYRIIECPGQQRYEGSTRNGVATSSWTRGHSTSFMVLHAPPLPKGMNLCKKRKESEEGVVVCPGSCMRDASVWGSGPYSGDSHACAAARHAGIIGDSGGIYRITFCPSQDSYEGSTKNGVTTCSSASRHPFSFTIGAVDESLDEQRPDSSDENERIPPDIPSGAEHCSRRAKDKGGLFFCPGNCTPRSVWGSGPYTGDSHACTAARHAGVIGSDGGLYRVTLCPGQSSFEGSARNGVRTARWSAYSVSFTVEAVSITGRTDSQSPNIAQPPGVQGSGGPDGIARCVSSTSSIDAVGEFSVAEPLEQQPQLPAMLSSGSIV